jgi:ubiquinone biosynthesis monooxygenase Coq7
MEPARHCKAQITGEPAGRDGRRLSYILVSRMTPTHPRLTLLDRLIEEFDRGLRTVAAANVAARPNPAGATAESVSEPQARRRAAGLMRVNHAGEIAAQALYHGQALTARNPALRRALLDAARDETDHLAWCEQRVRELGDRTSLLAPLWYAGSFAIGALAGLAGDRTSLGFVAETERQVIEHLESHMHELPADDERSRRIVEQMQSDEARHGSEARAAGGHELPRPVRELMRRTARVMTVTAFRV